MKIGVSTSCLYPEYTEDALEFLCRGGVKDIEIFFNTDCEITDGFVYDLLKIRGVRRQHSRHTPIYLFL
ncbi:MAG: hypothetical protein KBS41_03570 [Oscillospiraceae bacterium]|nr:hypothetical protein [Candidatus Equicaccousia limihippi]